MSTFGRQYEFAIYCGLMAQLENFERQHLATYGTSSAFKECRYRIEPGYGLLVYPFGDEVRIRLFVELNGRQWCELKFLKGPTGAARIEFQTLDDLQDWLELQGDPTE